MKLSDLHENMFRYQVGDTVKTPFGPGKIESEAKNPKKGRENDDYYSVKIINKDDIKKFDLDKDTYVMGSFEFNGIIEKGKK